MKKGLTIVIALLILALCSCGMTVQQGESSMPGGTSKQILTFKKASYELKISSLNELEEKSELIVKATVMDGSTEIRFNTPDLKNGIAPDSHFLTPVRIEQIYKDDGKFKQGDIIKIEEYCATAPSPTEEDVTIVFSFGFYMPMKAGQQYFLFLKKPQFDGDYLIVRNDMGKFLYNEKTRNPDNIKNLSNDELEIGSVKTKQLVPQEYFDIAVEVMKKYGK